MCSFPPLQRQLGRVLITTSAQTSLNPKPQTDPHRDIKKDNTTLARQIDPHQR